MVIAGLLIVLVLVLVLPFLSRTVQANLEIFLLIMGLIAAWIAKSLNMQLVLKSLKEPIMITSAVFIAGLLFLYLQDELRVGIKKALKVIPLKMFVFLTVVILGLISGLITVIVASLVLVEIVYLLDIERKHKINFTIIACFAISMGGMLTPIGHPLSTITVSKMGQDFWYLYHLLGDYIIPGIFAIGLISTLAVDNAAGAKAELENDDPIKETKENYYWGMVYRAVKVYLFVVALVFLGEGLEPLINTYLVGLSAKVLCWINIIMSIFDRALLAAAELSMQMSQVQVQAILMGLLTSGGMLIQGNIPNLISSSMLGIESKEWAKLGVPLGLSLMLVYFVILISVL